MRFASFLSGRFIIATLVDPKLVNPIAMVMAYVCLIWGLGTSVCLITPNFHQSVSTGDPRISWFTCSSTWLGSMSQIRSSYGSVLSFSVSWEINSLKRMESRFFESKNIRNQSPRSAFFMRRSRASSLFEYPVLALRWKLKIIKLCLKFFYSFENRISNQFKTSNWVLIIRNT